MKAWIALLLVALCAVAVSADPAELDFNQITQAVEAFKQAFLRPPFDRHLLSVKFTTLEAQKEYHNDIQLTHDETWSSWCLDVTVGVNVPEELRNALPATFYRFKVFYNPTSQQPEVEESESSSESSSDEVFCTMQAMICPDGSVASRTPDCKFICGAAPIGGLSYDQVSAVRDSFVKAYGANKANMDVSIDSMYGKIAKLTPAESYSDYCLDVSLPSTESSSNYPAVYNGVRVFYYTYYCSSKVCSDGTLVGCNSFCPEEESGSPILVPVIAIIFIITLSTCCCYVRRRRCAAKCNAAATPSSASKGYTPVETQLEDSYPAEQFALFQNQEPEDVSQVAIPMMPPMYPPVMPMMYPQMMSPQMMHPPQMHPQVLPQMMPPMPPPIMMMPNGTYPVMMQAPNGMWFPAPPAPEEQ